MSTGNGSLAALSTDELRAAVRAVLRDVLPAVAAENGPPAPTSGPLTVPAAGSTGGTVSAETVTLRTDADLDALVRRVATLCENPSQRAALRAGRHRFRLASTGAAAPGVRPQAAAAAVHRVESGAVTERAVRKAAADGLRLVVGRRAVLTPLARDRARVLGVEIERER